MNILAEIQLRFQHALSQIIEDPTLYLEMIKPSQNPQFGDFQANCAMPLAKPLKQNPREIASRIVEHLQIEDLCEPPEIAGPGFINLKVKTEYLSHWTSNLLQDDRLGVPTTEKPRTIVIDYSGPNVAKPMHVGHLRSSVIGAALYNLHTFLGHHVIGDNHIGDWGTQFGMIIYGYKHFRDEQAYQTDPVSELSRLYRLVHQLCQYDQAIQQLPAKTEEVDSLSQEVLELQTCQAPKEQAKEHKKKIGKTQSRLESLLAELQSELAKVQAVEENKVLLELATSHQNIVQETRAETAKLHAGDKENLALWNQFLPPCLASLDRMYEKLGIQFDLTKGESSYQDQLADVVSDLKAKGLATESEGAICIFLEGKPLPFLVQKTDGAFTYATTDLATIQFRIDELKADLILYVVGTPQSEHFELLFESARLWGYQQTEFHHVKFGSVLDENRQMYRTRSGDTVGLESLIDEGISRAYQIVAANDDAKRSGPELNEEERDRIAEIVGLGAIKYADLFHNRESDYVFDWDKMLATNGDTGTYLQYAYARTCGIMRKGNVDTESLSQAGIEIRLDSPTERELALLLCRLNETLEEVCREFQPKVLSDYLLNVAKSFSRFWQECPVLKAEDDSLKMSRLAMTALTGRMIKLGLKLLGIETSEKM